MQKHISVLLVDDNAFMRESLRSVLSIMGNVNVVGEAKNGEDAIKLAKELSPEVILMDINMSPVNGFEATRKIVKENPAVKIIGFSHNKNISYVNNMLRLGAKGYVVKSSSYIVIMEAINRVLAGEKYIDKEIEVSSCI
jgi:two-component system, NarL family, invasion response regulator UvrY